jgi:hypothetical protein
MPHFKCIACKTRLYRAPGPDDLVGDLCPGCGCLLEPVGELTEIVGFRRYRTDDSPPGPHQRIADRVEGFFARRQAGFSPEAVADAIALPTPNENS